jgi:two-component system, LuxR family, sensor kinase FixL
VVAPLVGEAIHRFNVEESLQESEERFRLMFERHNAVMLLVEPDSGTLVDANPAAAAFYGFSQQRLKNMSVADLDPASEATLAAHRRAALHESDGPLVARHRTASGDVRIVEVHSSLLHIKGRKLVFSIIHDITDRKALEKQVLDISEQERRRVGQDLHDSLGGKLTGAALIGKALAQKLAANNSAEAALAEEVVQCINESIGETRSIARGLCPVELAVSGLTGSLDEFASETRRRSGVSCRFVAAGKVEVQDQFVATHLFRIAQEAVSNAIRHARPSSVTIRLATSGGRLVLEIRDDGIGLPKNLETSAGLGLRTMKYRASLLGAQLMIRPLGTGGGTIVACQLPAGNVLLERQDDARKKHRP